MVPCCDQYFCPQNVNELSYFTLYALNFTKTWTWSHEFFTLLFRTILVPQINLHRNHHHPHYHQHTDQTALLSSTSSPSPHYHKYSRLYHHQHPHCIITNVTTNTTVIVTFIIIVVVVIIIIIKTTTNASTTIFIFNLFPVFISSPSNVKRSYFCIIIFIFQSNYKFC